MAQASSSLAAGPIPKNLQARLTDLPIAVTVFCRAFTADRRPLRLHSLWALSAAVIQTPFVIALILRRRTAITADRTAVIVVTTATGDTVLVVVISVVWMAVLLAMLNAAADLAIAVVQPHAGALGVLAALSLLLLVAITPIVTELAAILTRRRTNPGPTAEGYTTQLRRLGLTAWTLSSWAAWPPGRRSGRQLLDQLLTDTPTHVWLVASARNHIALERFRERGFVTPTGGGLLCLRPATGANIVPPPTPRRTARNLPSQRQ